jgi:hypothetical protein
MSYIKDDGGVYTDSAEFVDYIPEIQIYLSVIIASILWMRTRYKTT